MMMLMSDGRVQISNEFDDTVHYRAFPLADEREAAKRQMLEAWAATAVEWMAAAVWAAAPRNGRLLIVRSKFRAKFKSAVGVSAPAADFFYWTMWLRREVFVSHPLPSGGHVNYCVTVLATVGYPVCQVALSNLHQSHSA